MKNYAMKTFDEYDYFDTSKFSIYNSLNDTHATLIKAMNESFNRLHSIDDKLLELIISRNNEIQNIESLSNGIAATMLGDIAAVKLIYKSWQMFGFSSPIVKASVKRVRDVFFTCDTSTDKEESMFNQLVFAGLGICEYEYNINNAGVWLKFSFCKCDFDIDTFFTLWIPAQDSLKWCWNIDRMPEAFKLFVSENGKQKNAVESFKTNDIAQAVKEFLEDREQFIAKHKTAYKCILPERNIMANILLNGTDTDNMNDFMVNAPFRYD